MMQTQSDLSVYSHLKNCIKTRSNVVHWALIVVNVCITKWQRHHHTLHSKRKRRLGWIDCRVYEVLHDRQGKNQKELTVNKGDYLQVSDHQPRAVKDRLGFSCPFFVVVVLVVRAVGILPENCLVYGHDGRLVLLASFHSLYLMFCSI